MNKKNTKYLLETFPDLYKQYYLPATDTCMCWGFDCGDGWFEIIKKLSEDLAKTDSNVEATQVKEKFGSLRYYFDNASEYEEISKLIKEAEKQSAVTCEVCGKEGKIGGKGWLKCLCQDCRKKND